MKMNLKSILNVFVILITTCNCAKILGIFNVPSKSHHILGESLLKALASQGHEVTMLSPFTSKNVPSHYKELVIPHLVQYKDEKMSPSFVQQYNYSTWYKMANLMQGFNDLHEIFFDSAIVQDLIKTRKQYDVAIVTYFGNDAVLALADHVATHTIIFSTLASNNLITKITRAPSPISYVPNLYINLPDEMSFTERTKNLFVIMFTSMFECFIDYKSKIFISKYLPNAASIQEIRNKISLVLLNSDYSIESPKPYVPNMIQVGGLQIEEPKPLPKDLQDFMDNSKGVIFFSLGSNVRASDMNNNTIEEIIKCFAKLPYNVLWKFEKSNTYKLPKNVKISDWFPQRDILAHKNLKIFITHGGLLSTTEALYHGVPMIGVPIFGDQEKNVNSAVFKGYLVELPFTELSEQSLTDRILEIMNNPKYKENAQRRSRIFRDQPMKPMDTAVYWVEYVLRHNGAHHLKTSALKLNFFQENLLDVLAVVVLVLLIMFYTVFKLFQFLRKIFSKKIVKKNIKQNKKSKTL